MVLCTLCNTANPDRHCHNSPRLCYGCCTSNLSVRTCAPHYHQMGNTAQAARLASRLVVPSLLGEEVDSEEEQPPPPGAESASSASSSQSTSSPAPLPGPPVQAGPVPLHPQALLSAVASLPPASHSNDSVMASVASLASLVLSLQSEIAQLRRDHANTSVPAAPVNAPVIPPLAPAAAGEEPLPFVPPSPALPPLVSPPARSAAPHRAAVLDRGSTASQAAVNDMINRFSALDEDSDEDDRQVRPQLHTTSHAAPSQSASVVSPPSVLPDALIPASPGSDRDNAQVLSTLLNNLHKKEVKYKTLKDLKEALDDWWQFAIDRKWPGEHLTSLREYTDFILHKLPAMSWSISEISEYHRLFLKQVYSGKCDMFARNAHADVHLMLEIRPASVVGTSSSSSSTSPSAHRQRKAKTPPAPREPGSTGSLVGKYAKGSCTTHPESTTHTTAQCRRLAPTA